jgi:hypothetical protein
MSRSIHEFVLIVVVALGAGCGAVEPPPSVSAEAALSASPEIDSQSRQAPQVGCNAATRGKTVCAGSTALSFCVQRNSDTFSWLTVTCPPDFQPCVTDSKTGLGVCRRNGPPPPGGSAE